MSKKISLFFDGTWNTPDSQTNAYTLFSLAEGYATGPDLKNLEDPKWKQILKLVVDKVHDADDRDHEEQGTDVFLLHLL